ncbi:MAG: OpgC domain-containing protein, partial [Pseudomonadota bacterium]
PWFLACVPIIRKVGTQSLAVFVVSIPLAVTLGWLLDLTDRSMLPVAAANIGGGAILITVAYVVGWFRKQPWRGPAPARAPEAGASSVAKRDSGLAGGSSASQPAGALTAESR